LAALEQSLTGAVELHSDRLALTGVERGWYALCFWR
jgi:hypothetical protein